MPQPAGVTAAGSQPGVWRPPHAARFSGLIRQTQPPQTQATQTRTGVPPAARSSRTPVIARAALAGGQPASRPVAAAIAAGSASGRVLPAEIRQFMEPRFNADFSRVRIHTGEQAARLSSAVSAQAFTTGGHIYFGAGRFQPDSSEGRQLIAHELTHTIQQGAAT
ncbi:MAG: DUF4157 domain-containing protein, partial [Gallionella sp.]|nr:DUF4157 domain-containing protein [Gallionella sp.]